MILLQASFLNLEKTYKLLSDGEDEFFSKTKSKTRDCREQSESPEISGAVGSSDDDNAESDS